MKEKTKKPGRPKLPQGKSVKAVNTTLPPEVYSWVQELGSGSASRGVRAVILAAFREKKNAVS